MDKNDKKIVMNKVTTICMEVIWSVLILVGVVVLVAESEVFCAIMAGIGFVASVIMVITDFRTLYVLLDYVTENNTVIIKESNSETNK